MNKYIITLFSLFFSFSGIAQADSFEAYRKRHEKEYNAYAQKRATEFEQFRTKRNKEFSKYLGEKWEKVEVKEGEKCPVPKPLNPEFVELEKNPICIIAPTVIPLPKAPKPIELTVEPFKESKDMFLFDFYGQQVSVRMTGDYAFNMQRADEQMVERYWNKFSSLATQTVLDDCVRNKEQLKLSDWAYVQFINKLTAAYYGDKNKNEAVFLQGYLLTQSGYDIRFIAEGDQLILGAAMENPIFAVIYMLINNRNYYFINYKGTGQSFYTFKEQFSEKSRAFSMVMSHEMEQIPLKQSEPINYFVKTSIVPIVQTSVNLNLIEFYKDYPQCEWDVYARCPMSENLQKKVLPPLSKQIQGKTQKEAANILINFVQTAFKYQADNDQFGYEKPFFIEEIFYYPASDCEDRAVLFAYLVRRLLNIEVVLLHYPNHLCTAVLFSEEIEGDGLVIGSKRYLICDPTYIGADIGNLHNDYKLERPKVYTIN